MVDHNGGTERRIREILAGVKNAEVDADLATPLYADGIALDSLETAEFAALLEVEYGNDPWSGDVMPETLGDVVAFYRTTTAAGTAHDLGPIRL